MNIYDRPNSSCVNSAIGMWDIDVRSNLKCGSVGSARYLELDITFGEKKGKKEEGIYRSAEKHDRGKKEARERERVKLLTQRNSHGKVGLCRPQIKSVANIDPGADAVDGDIHFGMCVHAYVACVRVNERTKCRPRPIYPP